MLLLIDPDTRRAEAARLLGGRIVSWDTYGSGDIVPTPYGDLDVDRLHDQLDHTATT